MDNYFFSEKQRQKEKDALRDMEEGLHAMKVERLDLAKVYREADADIEKQIHHAEKAVNYFKKIGDCKNREEAAAILKEGVELVKDAVFNV